MNSNPSFASALASNVISAMLAHHSRDAGQPFGRFAAESVVTEDRVALRSDRVREDKRFHDLVRAHAELPSGRRGPDRVEGVLEAVPITPVEVHHHDRPDAALL